MNTIKVDLPPNIFNNIAATTVCPAVQSAIQDSLALIHYEWIKETQKRLKSTIPEYLLGLGSDSIVYPYSGNPMSGAVILRGKIPNMLESGYGAFDMKVGFSKSGRKHTMKNGGWYMIIPFRHGTPGSFMYGRPMPKNIHNRAGKLENRKSLHIEGGQKVSWTGYKHKANIHDGLTRIIKQYESGKKQAQYMTFRKVSSNSDPLSWMHPGYKGVKIADSLEKFAVDTFTKCIERNLASIQK